MNRTRRKALCCAALAAVMALGGCMRGGGESDDLVRWTDVSDVKRPAIPEKLERDGEGVPRLKVYVAEAKKVEEMDLETYVEGVVAGEMKNDWPMAALEAQAILARTFALKFCQDKESKYEGADISTDVAEAQAYAPADVNVRVKQAVRGTRGEVMAYQGQYPYAWFHAHSGGRTDLPSVGLGFKGGDPAYLRPVASEESDRAPEDVRHWTATFTEAEVLSACRDAGLRLERLDSLSLGERGASGRAKALVVNGQAVSAPDFRVQIGANRLKSTLIDRVRLYDGKVTFTGRGFGHGVGLSQWGAYAMAESGSAAEAIVARYFRDVDIVKLW